MATLSAMWTLFFGFFPAWFQAFILGAFVLFAVIITMKIAAFVLDALPFV